MTESSNDENVFGKALIYVASAPLAWNNTNIITTEEFDVENEQYLRTILSLSDHHSVDTTEEIAAIERKVDITLEMVASLLRKSVDIPSVKEFKLGAHEISWQQTSATPQIDQYLIVNIYLHDLYPKPLKLVGQLKSVDEQVCVMELAENSSEVQQLLEKFIFLHHRRAIAQAASK